VNLLDRTKSRWYGKVPLSITLATAIGLLVLVTVGVMFAVGVWLAQKNTFDLLSANAHQTIVANVNQVEQHLRPAEQQTLFLAERIKRGEFDPADLERLGVLLTGALAAAPQIEAVMFIDPELQSYVAGRDPESLNVDLNSIDYSQDPIIRKAMENELEGPVWNPPIWRDRFQKTYLNRVHPVRREGEFIGAIVSVVSVQHLSDFITTDELETVGNRFILYGRDHVLAHWQLSGGYPGRTSEQPLPNLEEFADPVLAAIWQQEDRYDLLTTLPAGTEGHVLDIFTDEFAFLYRILPGYGPTPMLIGTYFRTQDVSKEIRRLGIALIAGFIVLLASLVAAIYVGRRIARPIVRFSSAAGRVRDLDVAKVEELPASMLRELNDQSIAFNSMLRALRWFELYVPKKIVERMIKDGDVRDTLSDARDITVMFTDIIGFSAVSENMSATEVAAFVNHHFSLLAGCIEAEGGTIDKFMGDAVMAFWGAPDRQSDNDERACRAALAIRAAIIKDNEQRSVLGKPSVGIRIGIHTGIATVGNIGAPGRVNYTIIGDTVNIGQRLEQLGSEILPSGTQVCILISKDTAINLGSDFKTKPAGRHTLKGRISEVEVLELI